MSKHSCYIENSQEARGWLALIGLLSNVEDYQSSDILTVYHGSSFGLKDWNIGFLLNDDSFTDCRGNLPLFKALTAVRDDSDYMQWFVADQIISFKESYKKLVLEGDFFLCNVRNIDSLKPEYYKLIQGMRFWHKATKEELIEHFKKKG